MELLQRIRAEKIDAVISIVGGSAHLQRARGFQDRCKENTGECALLLPHDKSARAAMLTPTEPTPNGLWAVTCYFNPMRYGQRLRNFRTFRKYLQVPLVTVELSYGSGFELEERDADILIQLNGGAVLWQKERLLNVALHSLPRECDKVAWLDCDVLFAAPNWGAAAKCQLDRFAIVQLFRQVHNLGAPWADDADRAPDTEFTQPSVARVLASGISAAAYFGLRPGGRKAAAATGFAWAARRDVLDRHLLFDANILGGGDRAVACAAWQCFEELMQRHCMNAQQRRRYLHWAEPFHAELRADVGYLDVDIVHLWHGDLEGRKNIARHAGLQAFQFDPYVDIEIGQNGSWRWNTDKPELHEYVRGYFASRREDG